MLELSIVLIVIAFIAGTTLSVGTSRTGFARLKQTYDKLSLIEEAFAAYVSINGRLPCPAVGAAPRQPIDRFGYADCELTLVESDTALQPDFHVGVLPVQSLNLAQEFAFDGWGRRFTYIVDARFTTMPRFASTAAGGLIIKDSSSAAHTRSEEAVYIVASHGENGFGAWPKEGGGRVAFGAYSEAEKENVHSPNDITSMNPVFTQSPRSARFDDILYYFTKQQIIRRAGGILQGDSCDLARRTMQPYVDICDLASGEPRVGPVGCEVDDDLDNCPAEPREFRTHCVVRQVEMAKLLVDKCLTR